MADFPNRISYGTVLEQVAAYYGQGSPAWNSIVADSSTGFSMANYDYLTAINIHPVMARDGSTLCYYQSEPFPSYTPSTYEVVDSNVRSATYGGNSTSVKINGTATQSQVGGKTQTTFNSGAKTVSAGSRVMTVLSEATGYVFGARAGGWLGLQFSQALYDSGVSWAWSKDDWAHFIQNDADNLDKAVFSFLTGIDANGNSTMYAEDGALAQYFMMLREMGVFDPSLNIVESYNPQSSAWNLKYPSTFSYPVAFGGSSFDMSVYIPQTSSFKVYNHQAVGSGNIYSFGYSYNNRMSSGYFVSNAPVNAIRTDRDTGSSQSYTGTSLTIDGTTYYTCGPLPSSTQIVDGVYSTGAVNPINRTTPSLADVVKLAFNGDMIPGSSGVEGIEKDPEASIYIDPSLIDGQDRDTVLQQLRTNYPELFNDEIYQDVPQQDGTLNRKKYVPVPYVAPSSKPVTGSNHQNNPSANPETNTQTELEKLVEEITKLLTPTDIPDTGTGETPPTVIPVGGASSLWKIYNPTQAQVDAFGSWLWDSSFVEQIKKLFNDPMQAIIGIHKVFATPSIGGTATIKVGYLDSQVSSAWVNNQYTTVNCGSASLKEYFGNVFDYAPYTKVQLYLPFIGIVDLDVGDVMRSTISVVYHVDVLTGACLADVKVNRDGVGGVLYQYAGNAIVTYPVSAGNYMGMLAGVVSVAGGIAGTILSGGALAPALIGGAVGASHLHTDVSHSGGFSGCAGAMGSKKPYLIVSRPQIAMADNYQHYTGIPANSKVTLGSCNGYAKVKSVYVNSITRATEDEKNMIEAQLKAGVLV